MYRPDDPRLGELMVSRIEFEADPKSDIHGVGLIRFPCDEGVRRNGGRSGASEGPGVVMTLLPRFGGLHNRELDIDLKSAKIMLVDYGEVAGSMELEEAHLKLRDLVASCLQSGLVPLTIGGGNDQSWANGAGWIDVLRLQRKTGESELKLTVVNVDAHLDVRPMIAQTDGSTLAHSGSPFRQLIEMTRGLDDLTLIEFGTQGQQCSSTHVDYVLKNGGRIIWLSQLRATTGNGCGTRSKSPAALKLQDILRECECDQRHVFFSFDLDAIRTADCPGVSCPSPVGLTSEEALELCYVAGASPAVELMDISEYNPQFDDLRTGRLVVHMIYYFLLGLSQRKF